jgi:hypothetical protein
MTVEQLMSCLERFDRDMELLCFCDDEGLRQKNGPFRIYTVERVNVSSVTEGTNPDRTTRVEFDATHGTKQVVVVQITTDF